MKIVDPRLFRYSRNSRGLFFILTTIAIALAVLTILQGFLLAEIIVSLFQRRKSPDQLATHIIALALVVIARSVLQIITEVIATRISSKITNELRELVFSSLFQEDSRLSIRNKAGAMSTLLTSGIAALNPYFSKFVPQLSIAMFVPFLVGVVVAIADPISGLIVLCTLPLIPLFGILIGRYTEISMHKKWEMLQVLSNHLFDLLSGMVSLKVFGRAKYQTEKLESSGEQYRKETMTVLKISFLSSFALELIATLSVALIAVSIGIRLIDGKTTLLSGLFVLILAPEAYWPIRNVAAYFHAASDGAAAASEIFEVLDVESHEQKIEIKETMLTGAIQEISWNNLEIEYAERTQIIIPAGSARKGEILALTGPSGIGKSSFFKNLLGFHNLSSGEIFVSNTDGNVINLSSISISSWRERCSWVPQDPTFPTGTIKEMFQRIKPIISEAEIWRILRASGMRRSELPAGLDSSLTDFTSGLSSGQIRRLATARALTKSGDVFLFDELTASTDEFSERELISLLRELKQSGKIVLVISHRNEVIKNADKVLDFTKIGAVK